MSERRPAPKTAMLRHGLVTLTLFLALAGAIFALETTFLLAPQTGRDASPLRPAQIVSNLTSDSALVDDVPGAARAAVETAIAEAPAPVTTADGDALAATATP